MHMYDDPFIVISGNMMGVVVVVMSLAFWLLPQRLFLQGIIIVLHAIAQSVVLVVFWTQQGSAFNPWYLCWVFSPAIPLLFAFAYTIKLSDRPGKKKGSKKYSETDRIWPNPNIAPEDAGWSE